MFGGVALSYKGTLTCPGALRRYQLPPSAVCSLLYEQEHTILLFKNTLVSGMMIVMVTHILVLSRLALRADFDYVCKVMETKLEDYKPMCRRFT